MIANRKEAEDVYRQVTRLNAELSRVVLPWSLSCGYWIRRTMALLTRLDKVMGRDGSLCMVRKSDRGSYWYDGDDRYTSLARAKSAIDQRLRDQGYLLLDDDDLIDQHGTPTIK